jgi:hypothetical protein
MINLIPFINEIKKIQIDKKSVNPTATSPPSVHKIGRTVFQQNDEKSTHF